ncbi:MAG: DUF3043 domain-containing protein [Mycobacteriales bacterium]
MAKNGEHGKGRPTPKRSAARGQRRTATGPPPRTRKEAAARRSAEVKARRSESRRAMRTGDVRKLPPALARPERVFVRDVVDARRNFGALLLPSLAMNLIAAFVPVPAVRALATVAWLGLFVLSVGDSFALGAHVRRALRKRYPDGTDERTRTLVMYGASRGTLPRRFRLPPPRVAIGERA